MPGEPVRLLVAQLAGAADPVVPWAWRRRQAEDRDLVDGRGDLGRPERRSPAARTIATTRSASRLADASVGRGASRSVDRRRPSRRRRSMIARRVGFTPTPRRVSSASRMDRPGDEPERGRRDDPRGRVSSTARTADRLRSTVQATGAPSAAVASSDRHARVPAACARCDRASRPTPGTVVAPSAARPASRMADLTWALGTGVVIVDRPERGVADHGHGRQGVAPAGVDLGAHRAQRLDDTGDRTAAQRSVAVEDGGQPQPREEPGDEPDARPGVAAVEHRRRARAGRRRRARRPGSRRSGRRSRPRSTVAPSARDDAGGRAHVGAVARARDPALARRPARPAAAPDG